MQTTPGSSCRLIPLCRAQTTERASMAAIKTTMTSRRNAAHISIHVPSPRDPTTSSGEQNLNGEPSWDGRGSAGPDDTTWQTNPIVSIKFKFSLVKSNNGADEIAATR